MKQKKIYRVWTSMKQRCDNPNIKYYEHYGGRGITYCKRWSKFENFLKDMGEKPEGKSLDRIDNNKNYSKNNCKWATWAEQNRNTRRNVIYKGECATDASKRLGGGRNLVQRRIKNGWDIKKAFTTKLAEEIISVLSGE